jgi:uncharacterized protein (DUF1330 family)
MPAYVIAEIEVTDPVGYEEYKALVPAVLARYGGRYLARGGEVAGLEGDAPPARVVIMEFPSLAQAKAWWACAEYTPAKAIRHRTAKSRLVAVAGLDSPLGQPRRNGG